jgi:hypothetical protein
VGATGRERERVHRKVHGRKRSWLSLIYSLDNCEERLKEITKQLSQDSRCQDRILKSETPKYEAGMLPTQLREINLILKKKGVREGLIGSIWLTTRFNIKIL